MTNDELEAYRAMLGVMDNRSLGNALRDKLPGILDEVERLRSRAAPDPCEAQVPFDTPDGVTWFPAPLGSADPFDRATRAEAHAERLKATMREISATILAGMEPDPPYCESCESAGETQVLLVVQKVTALVSQALSAYRGVKDEACSRPSDALDAPVQPTSSHLGNGADQ